MLVPPKPDEWHRRFQQHKARLHQLWPRADIQHIGSTAIGGIQSKDCVDLLIGVQQDEIPALTQTLTQAGYELEGQRAGHAWLCWPSSAQREAIVHIMDIGAEAWRKRLLFRDYLRANPTAAREYEQLKQTLSQTTKDWGDYTQRKASFVARLIELAQTPST